MVSANLLGRMGGITKVSGKIITWKEMELFVGLTVKNLLECIRKIRKMEREFFIFQMELKLRVFGKRAKYLEKVN